MNRSACDVARAALVRHGDAREHLAECDACRAFASRLARVDASLDEAARRAAAETALPPELRARILAQAARVPVAAPPRPARGRLVDWALRAAAVAAVLVGAAWLVPGTLLASEDAFRLPSVPHLELDRVFADRLRWDEVLPADLVDPDEDTSPIPFAIAATGLLAAAWAAARVRRESR